MQDHIFISYKNEEVKYADQLRTVLEQLGYKVWWDQDIQTGRAWHQVIDDQLKSAKSVVVLWSKRSAESKWVGHEAAHAMARNVYVPVRIESVDIPIPYDRIQAATLTGWNGDVGTSEFPKFMDRLIEVMGPSPNDGTSAQKFTPWPEAVPRSWIWRIWSWIVTNSMGLLAIVVALIVIIVVSDKLKQQVKTLEQATDDLKVQIESVTSTLEEALFSIRRDHYGLIGLEVTYSFSADDDSVSEWRDTQGEHRHLLQLVFLKASKVDPTDFRCPPSPYVVAEPDLTVSVFDGPSNLQTMIARPELSRRGNDVIPSRHYHSGWPGSPLTSLDEDGDTPMSSVEDLLGSKMIIFLGASVEDDGSPSAVPFQLPGMKLRHLEIVTTSGFRMYFNEKRLDYFYNPAGPDCYLFEFPTTFADLRASTKNPWVEDFDDDKP